MTMKTSRCNSTILVQVIGLLLVFSPPTLARDYLKINRSGEEIVLRGQKIVEAKNGDILFRHHDGRLWSVAAKEIKDTAKDDKAFLGLTQDKAKKLLLEEFDESFHVHTTARYLICSNTTTAYSKWVGALYEKLHRNFMNYWKNRGFELNDPDVPLVIVVFNSKDAYFKYARKTIGAEPTGMDAYYNVESNRVVMYDLTGADRLAVERRPRSNAAQINTILAQPEAAAMVATIIHEATHQMACNSGLHQRYALYPFWVSEGLAMYFEAPQLKRRAAWRGPKLENRLRIIPLRQYHQDRPADSIKKIVCEDSAFRSAEATNAYSESWALFQFLMIKRRKDFNKYLKMLSEKRALEEYTADERLEDFIKHFGELEKLDKQFLAYVRQIKY